MEDVPFDYWPLTRRPNLELPGEARLAFWIGLNVEHFPLNKPATSIYTATAMLKPDPLNYGWRDYAPRIGIWRMMDLLDKYGIRASVLLNSDACSHYPEIIDEGNKRGWIWLAHGRNNSILQPEIEPDDERRYLAEVIATIENATGRRPRGWLGPALTETFDTPDILAELEVEYLLDWCNDDQPYPMKVKHGRMIGVPYAIEINDIPVFLGRGHTAEQFGQMIVDQFDVLYAEGQKSARIMCVALHPFLINQPFRHKYLDRAMDYVTSHDHVWFATTDEIADWYFQNYYEEAVENIAARTRLAGPTPEGMADDRPRPQGSTVPPPNGYRTSVVP